MTANIVVDPMFGDGGKGMLVDHLCRKSPEDKLVIRYTGGPQAGHTVNAFGGTSHVFSSFGSGTLAGYPSFFSKHTLVYLPNLVREFHLLLSKGVKPVLRLDPQAKLITPYDAAWNRMQHKTGNATSSTCGVGIGPTVERNMADAGAWPLYAVMLGEADAFRYYVNRVYTYYAHKAHTEGLANEYSDALKELEGDFDIWKKFERWDLDHQYFIVSNLHQTIKELKAENLVFEGAQGIYLDQHFGTHPHNTWGDTTSRNAWEIIADLDVKQVNMFYVTRCYTTRHGDGPMFCEEWTNPKAFLDNIDHETNKTNPWQGRFRYGKFNYDAFNCARQYDRSVWRPGKEQDVIDNVVITCVDQMLGRTTLGKIIEPQRMYPLPDNIRYSTSPSFSKLNILDKCAGRPTGRAVSL